MAAGTLLPFAIGHCDSRFHVETAGFQNLFIDRPLSPFQRIGFT
jgi:hypothetical protein